MGPEGGGMVEFGGLVMPSPGGLGGQDQIPQGHTGTMISVSVVMTLPASGLPQSFSMRLRYPGSRVSYHCRYCPMGMRTARPGPEGHPVPPGPGADVPPGREDEFLDLLFPGQVPLNGISLGPEAGDDLFQAPEDVEIGGPDVLLAWGMVPEHDHDFFIPVGLGGQVQPGPHPADKEIQVLFNGGVGVMGPAGLFIPVNNLAPTAEGSMRP